MPSPTPRSVEELPGTAASPEPAALLVGRQPIFERQKKLFGYRLRFHDGAAGGTREAADRIPRPAALSATLGALPLKTLTVGGQAFLPVTVQALLTGEYRLLPPQNTVLDLQGTVAPGPALLAACRNLEKEGYALALGAFVLQPEYEPLLDLTDVIKVDFPAWPLSERFGQAQRAARRSIPLLAEKIDTHADFRAALESDCTLVQGRFFCRPELLAGQEMPTFKRMFLLFLAEANRLPVDFAKLERIVRREVSLSVRLLRYLNSAAVGMPQPVDSIRQALTLLGERPLRKWASLVAMTCMAEDKPSELTRLTLVRARFCELMAQPARLPDREFDLFLLGMLSTLDAMVDRPMDEIMLDVPVALDVRTALLGAPTPLGKVLALVRAVEAGSPEQLSERIADLGCELEAVAGAYTQAITWTEDTFR